VARYEINYRYFIEECELEYGGNFPPVTVSVNVGTQRRYTLNNSASTPVEEDSYFRITLTAVNSVTRSIPSQSVTTTTAEAGTCCISLVIYLVALSLLLSPWVSAVPYCQFCECH
jgi:hypothetical protein